MIGTNLLVQIFDVLVLHHCKEKIIRRLYCESDQAGIKSYRFVNDSTRGVLDQIIPKCAEYTYERPRIITMVLTFEELAKLQELHLLKDTYVQTGGVAKKAYNVCNKKTQTAIQRLGLLEISKNQ
jgi:hypothetical protein